MFDPIRSPLKMAVERLEPGVDPQADPVFRHDVLVGGLAPLRFDGQCERPASQAAAAHQTPAKAVVAPGIGQPQGNLR